MSELIAKWTSLITGTSALLTGLCVAVAVLALGVLIVLAIVTHDDKEKAAKVKNIVTVLGFVSVFAVISALVSWAIA